ncbi:hypothetical protein LCGC14_2025630 [marine sediment metagenome]|uniref:dATP/dGTP diphosphohydrolase N-terminal domain-containing protein n=1 Tax=marine sediment metagenome TaxID=412755 RepID=A0A0F9H9L5_9ZZZZ
MSNMPTTPDAGGIIIRGVNGPPQSTVTIHTTLSVKGGLPDDPKGRKDIPLYTGVLDYFPDALIEVAKCSKAGNDQHNPGEPLHWAKEKSTDHADCIMRHLMQRGTRDTDGILHSAKIAWRALAQLQIELDEGNDDE